MSADVLIPTCKNDWDISPLIGEIFQCNHNANVFYSCLEGKSAAINRNHCLNNTSSDYVIMADDDITDFFPGWEELMTAPLKSNDNILYVSARLMNECGAPQIVMGGAKNIMSPHVAVTIAPSACVAYRRDDTRFWEEYLGSGFEDTDFHFQLKEKYGNDKKVIINNGVKLTHKHEMKNQNGLGPGIDPFNHNATVFDRRWPGKRAALKL